MKSPYPIRTHHNVNHWKFSRMLPHGSLPTRHFSMRPRDPESDPWFKVSLIVIYVVFFIICAFESGVLR
jgi:hypothetical protein